MRRIETVTVTVPKSVNRPADDRDPRPSRASGALWHRASLLALLAGTALLYLWDLAAGGWANQFYAAAVQAGSTSWKAMLFGSSDAANAITVDKAPGALWPMDLSARVFGFNAWSMLVPQALAGVAAVGVLYATVRRVVGHWPAFAAGAVLALTPVAALMFRFNNPDALLVLLLTVAAYCVLRAIDTAAGAWWLPLAGVAVGFGFLVKMMQSFLVLPAFAVVYVLAAQVPWRTRIVRSLTAIGAVLVSAGWYLVVAELWPADSRPYIGGSQRNSIVELTLGYNGFGRLTGNETGGLGNTNWDVGWDRLFGQQMGGQIAWLLPAALLLGVAGLWVLRRAPRTDPRRAALLLWLGWLLVTGAVFSFSDGILHPYYTVALAPAIAGAVGVGASLMWQRRSDIRAVIVLSVALLGTVGSAVVLLRRTPDWLPWCAPAIAVVGVLAAVLLLVTGRLPRAGVAAVLVAALCAALAGPTAYTLATVTTPKSGAMPSAGPAGASFHGPPGGKHGGGGPGPGGMRRDGAGPAGAGPAGAGAGGMGANGTTGGGGGRPAGGPFGAVKPGANLVTALRTDSDQFTWAAAVVGSDNAAGYQLAVGAPVMAMGGYNGTDPAPTLDRFAQDVAAHRIHYFIDGSPMFGMRGADSGSRTADEIATWVKQHFAARTVDGVTVYDLTAAQG